MYLISSHILYSSLYSCLFWLFYFFFVIICTTMNLCVRNKSYLLTYLLNINNWCSLSKICSVVYLRHYPSEATQLLMYEETVRKLLNNLVIFHHTRNISDIHYTTRQFNKGLWYFSSELYFLHCQKKQTINSSSSSSCKFTLTDCYHIAKNFCYSYHAKKSCSGC